MPKNTNNGNRDHSHLDYDYDWAACGDHENNGNHYGWGNGKGHEEGHSNGLGHEKNHCHDEGGHTTIIDFNLDTILIGGQELSSSHEYMWGSYAEDGFTFDWYTFDFDAAGNADVDPPFADLDGDGDIEFTTVKLLPSSNDLSESWGTFTRDSGENFDLVDATVFVYDTPNHHNSANDGIFMTYSTGSGDNFQTAYAFSTDANVWTYYYYSSEVVNGVVQVDEQSGNSSFDFILEQGYFTDMDAFDIYVQGDMAIGDFELA